jgi:hypothetical protein
MAAKRHKKKQKNYRKLTEANPSYRGYLLKARIRVSSQFSRFLSRFFGFLCLLRLFLFYLGVCKLQLWVIIFSRFPAGSPLTFY